MSEHSQQQVEVERLKAARDTTGRKLWTEHRARQEAEAKLAEARTEATHAAELYRAEAEHRGEAWAEAERLRHIIKGVHGALTDAATVPVPDLDADLYESVMQIVRERDGAQRRAEDCCRAGERACAELVRERDGARAEVGRWRVLTEYDTPEAAKRGLEMREIELERLREDLRNALDAERIVVKQAVDQAEQAEAKLEKVVRAVKASHPHPCTDAHTNAGCRICAALAAAKEKP